MTGKHLKARPNWSGFKARLSVAPENTFSEWLRKPRDKAPVAVADEAVGGNAAQEQVEMNFLAALHILYLGGCTTIAHS